MGHNIKVYNATVYDPNNGKTLTGLTLSIDTDELHEMLKNNTLRWGVVYGFTPINEVKLEDFENGENIVNQLGEGVIEIISYDFFVGRFSNEQLTEMRLKAEIPYGMSSNIRLDVYEQEETGYEEDNQLQVDEIKEEKRSYDPKEQAFYCDLYMKKINESKNMEELDKHLAGVLYPTKDGKWLRPITALSSTHRDELKAAMRAKRARFHRENDEKILNHIIYISDHPNFSDIAPKIDVIKARTLLKIRKEKNITLNREAYMYLRNNANSPQGK